jgi:hypothetical protein
MIFLMAPRGRTLLLPLTMATIFLFTSTGAH